MSFKKNKYKILKKVLSRKLVNFIYDYFLNKRSAARFLFDYKQISPFTQHWGIWTDSQIPNTYSVYGDVVMDTLLEGLRSKMEKETERKLIETYSYARIYKTGDILHRHKDRFACEVSTTLHLGGDMVWPIYLDPTGKTGGRGLKIELDPGDMLIYSGCKVEHWRDPFPGKDCAQVFLHYNDAKGKNALANKYDGRPLLGLEPFYKGFKP